MEHSPELFYPLGHELTLSPAERQAIPLLLETAAHGVAAPRQSGFEVKAAAMNVAGDVAHGGNREYGLSRAYVHGEEAVVSKLLSDHPDVPLLGVGFYAEGDSPADMLPCPCGNCRDVLLAEASPDLLLVAGNERIAVATRLGMYLMEEFAELDMSAVRDTIRSIGYEAALSAMRRGVTAYLPESLKADVYGVALIDTDQHIFTGSFDTTAGYDAITPGVAAIQTFRNRSVGSEHHLAGLSSIIIVHRSGAANPAYRDRNALTELDELLPQGSDNGATPVYLIEATSSGTPQRVRMTDTHAWLPFPFTAASMGQAELLTEKRQTLQENL